MSEWMSADGPDLDSQTSTPRDTRSPSAKAAAFVSKITTASVMLVLPAWAGWWLDQRLGTVALFLFLGMLLGMVAGGWQLYKLTVAKSSNP